MGMSAIWLVLAWFAKDKAGEEHCISRSQLFIAATLILASV